MISVIRSPVEISLLVGKWSVSTRIDQSLSPTSILPSVGKEILCGMWMTAADIAFDVAAAFSRGQTPLAGLSENLGVTFSHDVNDANFIHLIPFAGPPGGRELRPRGCLLLPWRLMQSRPSSRRHLVWQTFTKANMLNRSRAGSMF